MSGAGAEPTENAADRLAAYLARDEVRRRFVHVAGAIPPVAYLLGILSWAGLRWLYVAGLAIALALEFLRLVVGLDWWVFQELTREYERSNLAGYALFVIGSAVTVLLVDDPLIAVSALLMLSIVDPVSGLLAENEFREPKRPPVLAVAFALSGVIALLLGLPLHVAVLGAAATTLADGVTPVIRGHAIDDNLTIPIAAAFAMWVGLQLPV